MIILLLIFLLLSLSALAFVFKLLKQEKNKNKQGKESLNNLQLASISHEIKTPLSAISSLCDLLLDEESSKEEQSRCKKSIKELTNTLLQISSDLHYTRKQDLKHQETNIKNTPLEDLVKNTFYMFDQEAKKKKIVYTINFSSNVPRCVLIDSIKFKQILTNLLSNSLKFTQKGYVNLFVNSKALGKKSHQLNISVKDSGIGLKETDIKKLFKKYFQASASIKKSYGGTGLGLYISQELAKAMGGEIKVRSHLNTGSTFTLSLIVQEGFLEKTKHYDFSFLIEELEKKKFHVLFADDYKINQDIFYSILKDLPLTLDTVSNGLEAVEAAQKTNYDLVFLDLKMPILDGKSASSKILKSFEKKALRAPWLIATSADSLNKRNLIKENFQDVLEKPFTKKNIGHVFETYLKKNDSLIGENQFRELESLGKETLLELSSDFYQVLEGKIETLKKETHYHKSIKRPETLHACKGLFVNMAFFQCAKIITKLEKKETLKKKDIEELESLYLNSKKNMNKRIQKAFAK